MTRLPTLCLPAIVAILCLQSVNAATVTIVTDSAGAESGYAHFLSTYLGHDVTVRTDLRNLDGDKIDYLNSRDLVIVSTRTDSAAYYLDPRTSQWNGLTTPLLLHSAWMVRSNRWNWMSTDSTSAGTITDLAVNVPESPIFDHTTTTGGMVNLFAAPGQEVTRVSAALGSTNGVQLAGHGANQHPYIVQWDAGVEFYPGAGQTAGGSRLYFGNLIYGDSLAGLSDDGLQLVANAVQTSLGQPTFDHNKVTTLVRYEFLTPTNDKTGPEYLPTTVANGLVDTFDMAIKDTAGNIGMRIRDTERLRIDPLGNAADLDQAIANDKFFEFSIKPADSYALDLKSLSFDVARGGGSTPRGWGLLSSVDGFTDVIATGTAATIEPVFSNVVVGLGDPMFQGIDHEITFRMYAFSPGGGQSVEFGNITLMGIVPEPGTLLLLAVGGLWLLAGRQSRRRK